MSDAAELVYRQLERDRAVVARALDGHLTAAYQPIVDIARNVVVGYEALLRYRTDHDLIAPRSRHPSYWHRLVESAASPRSSRRPCAKRCRSATTCPTTASCRSTSASRP